MLDAVNISKFYGARKALDTVSFAVARGETIGVLGCENSGKSTLLKILSGYQTPTNGSVRIDGSDPKVPRVRNTIGYLPQNAPMPPLMRVGEYIRFRAGLKGLFGKRNVEKAFAGIAEFCPIEHVKGTLIRKLNRNEQQWLGIADALLGAPELLLLDDPTGGMDSGNATRVWELIAELTGRATVVVACRVLEECSQFCRRAVVLDRGKIVADGDPDVMFLENVEERTVVISVIAKEPVRETFRAIPGVRSVAVHSSGEIDATTTVRVAIPAGVDLRHEFSQLCARRGWIITGMHLEPVRLEDVFRDVR